MLCTWQRWISAKQPKVSRTARLSALTPSTMNTRAIFRSQPALDQVGQQCLDHGGVLRRSQGHRQHVFVPAPSMPTGATRTCSPTRSPSIWISKRSSAATNKRIRRTLSGSAAYARSNEAFTILQLTLCALYCVKLILYEDSIMSGERGKQGLVTA